MPARLPPLLLLAASLSAAAQDSQLLVNMNVHASQTYPTREEVYRAPNVDLRDTDAAQMRYMTETAQVGGGTAHGYFEGRMGLLRASAAAGFGYCCDLQGYRVLDGYSNATVSAQFHDTLLVTGAGLAVGTPVQYSIRFSIDGDLSNPSFEIGGFLSAYGVAEVGLFDLTSNTGVRKNWDASRDAEGVYTLTLDTAVGHRLSVLGRLAVGASIDDNARLARSAYADFDHSAGYQLLPSVAGLNTVGASGYDFSLAPVPEPGTGLLWVGGLAALAWRRQSCPCSPRPSSKSGASSAPPTANGARAPR